MPDTGETYGFYLLGTVKTSGDCDLWATPAGNDAVNLKTAVEMMKPQIHTDKH